MYYQCTFSLGLVEFIQSKMALRFFSVTNIDAKENIFMLIVCVCTALYVLVGNKNPLE